MPLFRRKRRTKRVLTQEQDLQRQEARPRILDNVAHWSQEMGISPGRVAVRDQRSRWGSASSLGNLNFNWRIAYMPQEVFDYVVIHELAHLREMNHSPRFWAIVAEYAPRYRTHRAWLRELGRRTHTTLE